jgi:hypothetical protein
VWTIEIAPGRASVEPGEPTRADVSVHSDPESLVEILDDPNALDAAISDGRVVLTGDTSELRRLLESATSAAPATG